MAGSGETVLRRVEDSIGGKPVSLVLNAPYRTLAPGSRFARGREAAAFCASRNANRALVVGGQVFASPFAGSSLALLVEDVLADAPPSEAPDTVIVPLDNAVWSARWSREIGALEHGSEVLLSTEALQEELSRDGVLILGAGENTYNLAPSGDIPPLSAADLELYAFRSRAASLIRAGIPAPATLAWAGAVAVFFFLALWALLPRGGDEPPPVAAIAPLGPPAGADLAHHQLLYIERVIPELSFFADKFIREFHFAGDGLTVEGALPPSPVLRELVDAAAAANLAVAFDAAGWRVTSPPPELAPSTFNLRPWADNLIALQAAVEETGWEFSMSEPEFGARRLNGRFTLSREEPGAPPLRALSEALRGRAAAVSEFSLEYGEGLLPSRSRITLQLSGLPDGEDE